jgi:hypothetical protein
MNDMVGPAGCRTFAGLTFGQAGEKKEEYG